MSFPRSQIDEVGDRKVAIKLVFGLSYRVVVKSHTVIVLVENQNPTGNKIHLLYILELGSFPLTFWQFLVGGKFINVSEKLFLLGRKQILNDIIYFL